MNTNILRCVRLLLAGLVLVVPLQASISFTTNAGSSSEGGGAVSLTVQLSTPAVTIVTVGYAATGGSAQTNDYSTCAGTLTFTTGASSATITFTPEDDGLVEGSETAVVTLAYPAGDTLGTYATYTHTILDNEVAPTPAAFFAGTGLSMYEDYSAQNTLVPVYLSAPPLSTVTVNYQVTGTATAGTDYTTSSGTLSFAAGSYVAYLNPQVINDAVKESDETMIITLTSPSGCTVGSPAAFTLTVLDNDDALTVGLERAQSSVTEGAYAYVYARLSAPADSTVTVDYAVAGGTATAGSDYTIASSTGTLTFSPGYTSAYLTLPTVDDTAVEGDETVLITLSSPGGATLDQTTHALTITDNDASSSQTAPNPAAPAVYFSSATSSSISEQGGTQTVYLYVSPVAPQPVVVAYAFGGTATAGTDYTAGSGSITISTGASYAALTVPVLDDYAAESTETVILQLTGASNANLGSITTNTFSILDDDAAKTVAFSAASSSVTEAATTTYIYAYLNEAANRPLTVDYAVSGGNATAGSDYTSVSGTLTFTTGASSAAIALPILDDAATESSETVVLTLSNSANASLGATTTHTVTIADDDTGRYVYLGGATDAIAETTTTRYCYVYLNTPADQQLVVDYTVGGTATYGADHNLASGNVVFAVGSSSAVISAPVLDDASAESDETVTVTLSAPAGAALGSPSAWTLTVADNDTTPAVSFSSNASSVSETYGSATVALSLSRAYSATVTAPYAVSGGTAEGGLDYVLAAGNATFAAGATTAYVTLTLVNDAVAESTETILLSLGTPVGATLGSVSTHTLSITDNDTPGAASMPAVEFTAATKTVSENGTAAIQVKLSSTSAVPVTVSYAVQDGTATGGADFSGTGGTVTIYAGYTYGYATVNLINDFTPESAETFTIVLSSPAGATLGTQSSCVVTVTDNDATPTVSFSSASAEGPESSSSIYVYATLSASVDWPVWHTLQPAGGTATRVLDHTLNNPVRCLMSVGATSCSVNFAIVNDSVAEEDETVLADLAKPVNATLASAVRYTYTIRDNDAANVVEFRFAGERATEATTTRTVYVDLRPASDKPVAVRYAVSGGTATNGSDFTASAGILTIPAGSTYGTLTLNLLDDAVAEADETVVLALSDPANAALGAKTAYTLSIRDNDGTPAASFLQPEIWVLEPTSGASASYKPGRQSPSSTWIYPAVRLSAPSSGVVSVSYTTTGGTATPVLDYDVYGSSLSFGAGYEGSSLSFSANSDGLVEDTETVSLRLSSATNATTGGIPATTVSILDVDGELVASRDAVASYQGLQVFGGDKSVDCGLRVLPDGSYLVGGVFTGNVDFDPGPGVQVFGAGARQSAHLSRFAADGSWKSTKVISAEGGYVDLQGGELDGAGGIVLCGTFTGNVDLDPGPGALVGVSKGWRDAFVARYDGSGALVWGRVFGGVNEDNPQDLAVGPDGSVVVAGGFYGTVDFDPGQAEVNRSSRGQSDVFVLKLDKDGVFSWVRTYGDVGTEDATAVAVDGQGRVTLAGTFSWSSDYAVPPAVSYAVDFDPGEGSDLRATNGKTDVFLHRLDAAGKHLWVRTLGSEYDDYAGDVAVAGSGEVFLSWSYGAAVDVDPGAAVDLRWPVAPVGYGRDACLSKFDVDGGLSWARSIRSTASVWTSELRVDDYGYVYLAGEFTGAADFDPSAGTDIRRSTSSYDAFVCRYSFTGQEEFAKTFGGAGIDEVSSVGFGPDGLLYVAGKFSGIVDFDPGAGIALSSAKGALDAFVLRLRQDLPAAGPLAFARTPSVSVGGQSRAWVRGGVRPYAIGVEPATVATLADGVLRGVSAGSFTVTVTDALGVRISTTGTVGQPAALNRVYEFPAIAHPADYLLVGYPYLQAASGADFTTVLTRLLGMEARPENWLAWAWTGAAGDGYEELSAAGVTVAPGRGCWMAVVKGAVLPATGSCPAATDLVDLPLRQGWNILANPYAAAVSAEDLLVVDGGVDRQVRSAAQSVTGRNLWTYDRASRQYASAASLAPGQGAWLFVQAAAGARVFFVPGYAGNKAKSEGVLEIARASADEPLPPDPPGSLGADRTLSGAGGGGGGCLIRACNEEVR